MRASGGLIFFSVAMISLVAISFGLVGALFGWIGQALLVTLLVPAALLTMDYRIGLVLLIVIMPYANSQAIPQLGPLSIVNLLLAGLVLLYLLRLALLRMAGRPSPMPVERELLVYYVVPVTLAAMVGTLHVGEIPQHFLVANKIEHFGLRDYWVSQYTKTMLQVFIACIIGGAVVEYGKGMRFAVSLCIGATLFVVAMAALIGATGASFSQLRDDRNFLTLLGRQNNEAGVLLATAFGPMLFMQAYVRHKGWRWMLRACAALVACGVLVTFSRGAFLGMMAIVAAYVLHFRRIKTAASVLVAVVIAAALAPAAIWERLSMGLDQTRSDGIVTSQTDELTQGRVYTWKALAPEIARSPLWGRGELSTEWSNHVKTSLYSASHPHNMYLEILMDLGLLGAFAMFLWYRHVWRMFRRLGQDERVPGPMRGYFLGASTALLAMLIYGCSNGHYYPAPEQIFYWVSIGLAFGYVAKLRGEAPVPTPVPAQPAVKRRGGYRVPPERILGWKGSPR
jgi:O-antigen ligase